MRRLFAVLLLILSATFVLAPHAHPAGPTEAHPEEQTAAPPPTPIGNPTTPAPAGNPAAPAATPTAADTPPETVAPTPRTNAPSPQAAAQAATGQGAAGQTTGQTTAQRPTSTPYTGDLGIFEDPNRDKLLQTGEVLDTLRLHPGSAIADIGAGGGWFTVRAARRVAPAGRVYAEDINPHAVEAIRTRAQKEHLDDITTILGTPDDPKLAPNSLDAAVMLRVYHEIAHTNLLLPVLVAALKPGARFGVIDHPGNGADHGINPEVVRAEVTHAGLHYIGLYDFTKGDQNDYMEVFEKR